MDIKRISIAMIVVAALAACSSDDSDDDPVESGADPINIDSVRQLLNTNADIAYAAYSDALDTAQDLHDAIDTFAADRTQQNLDNAKIAWLVAREPYGQTEVYRFRLSPIDSTDYSSEDGPEGEINAWPLGEALIDNVVTDTSDFSAGQVAVSENGAGVNSNGAVDGSVANQNIIGDTNITIDASLLAGTLSDSDERDVITGYHAIEFMLWGQDLNDSAAGTDGSDRDEAVKTHGAANLANGGQRPLSDFTEATYGDRRVQFLQVVADKLVADLTAVRDAWAPGASNYRAEFTTIATRADAIQKLKEILQGMGTLSIGELAGERMQIAYTTNSQEDEHSCFSDNTHRDIWLNAEGVANSYYGDYAGYDSDLDGTDDETTRAVAGYGFDDYVADTGIASLQALASQLETALTETQTNYTRIDTRARGGEPVDVQIMSDQRMANDPLYDTIISLNTQGNLINDVAAALNISGSVLDPGATDCDTSDPNASC